MYGMDGRVRREHDGEMKSVLMRDAVRVFRRLFWCLD